MSTLTRITRTATRVATLPITAASFATGLVKGTVSRLAHAVAGGDVPEPRKPTSAAPHAGPQVVPDERFPPAAPQRRPEPPVEGYAHEPRPAGAPHVGSSRRPESVVDDWDGDAAIAQHPDEEPAAESVVEALARNDGPGEDQVDHAAISAAVAEAERVRGAPGS